MSWEGYERCLCRNGHLHEASGYYSPFDPEPQDDGSYKPWSCPDCGEPRMWWEQVDQTNNAGIQTALLEHRPAEICFCQDCGHQHQKKPPQYCCPENRRARDPQPLVPVGQRGYEVLETAEVFPTPEQADRRLYDLYKQREQEHQECRRDTGSLPELDRPDQDQHGRPRTRWAIECPDHGLVYLTEAEYDDRMLGDQPEWMCPVCGGSAFWDHLNYDAFCG